MSARPLFFRPPHLMAALVLVFAVAGCATRQMPAYDNANRAWNVFGAAYRIHPDAPAFVTECSLAWTSGKKSARILLDIWGDFRTPDQPATVRMDAWTNLGGSLSKLRENGHGLAAFYPEQLKGYFHADPIIGARLLGLPFPFSLADLADLLGGNFSNLVPQSYNSVQANADGSFTYAFTQGRLRSLTLDKSARPLSMSGETTVPEEHREKLGGIWKIDFLHYPEQQPGTPVVSADRLFLTLPGEHRGSLRIQSRELKLAPWPEEALVLNLPPGTELRALDGVPRDWTTGRPADEEYPAPDVLPVPGPEQGGSEPIQ
ncbi:MAG: hypothetical protein V3573_00715 [Desulfovibrionaceae bacterium]